MKRFTIPVFLIMFGFSACTTSEPIQKTKYDGKKLLTQKCASCHNLDMPPKTYEDEKAPPMMAVTFHIKDFIPVQSPSEKKPKFTAFFQDFVIDPTKEKSFCDPESLKTYGLMPSQKGQVTTKEIAAIAEYAYDYYDQEKFLAKMQQKAAFDALPKGQQLATQKGCLTCHGINKAKAAPAFSQIAKRPKEEIVNVIQNGSQGSWKGFERMPMPSFKDRLDDETISTLVDWIQSL